MAKASEMWAQAAQQGRKQGPSQWESAWRGGLNGALGGFEPQLAGAVDAMNPFNDKSYSQGRDEAIQANDAAFQENPLTYGGAYGTGMIGSMLVGPGLVAKGGQLAVKGANAAGNALRGVNAASKEAKIIEEAKSMADIYKARSPGFGDAARTGMGDAMANAIPQGIRNSIAPAVKYGIPAAGAANSMNNTVDAGTMNNAFPQGSGSGQLDQVGFQKLQEFLKNSGMTEEDKRRAAMKLQGSAEGRAVTNED